MIAFTQVARPHEDIREGRLTMDVFAADLWQVKNGKAPVEYQDRDLFFRKTYETKSLRNIFEIAEARLKGKSGDSVIQLQTPFGGGKTHTLIALYHKAEEWGAKTVVLDGTAFDPKEVRLWEEIERQLTGKVEITRGETAPGKDKLIKILSEYSPVLILMDEILEYATKAAAVKVGDSNLASQMLAFLQELTGAVSTVGNALLVLTLPSSLLEHYDEHAERLFQQVQKVIGRTERIYTPVGEEEIEYVIRKRLFENIDEKRAKEIVDEFVEYAKGEGLLGSDEASDYREKFMRSYPFKPEIIDVLYKRWGSFPTFQRTRGVLRLLSLVVHDLLKENIPFIRLGDFNLKNSEIRRELIKHIGEEWDSIIAQDITSRDSGAQKIDDRVPITYRPYKLGTIVSTTVFMLSFSGKGEKGATTREVKINTVYPDSIPSSVIDTVLSQLKEQLFYLSDEGLYFTNQPNLNRILLTKEENIAEDVIIEREKAIIEELIKKDLRESKFGVYIWPQNYKDVPDSESLKLVILNKSKPERDFIEKYGEGLRIYRNVLFFLCTDESQKEVFHKFIRKLIAAELVASDKNIRLTEAQKKELENKIKSDRSRIYEEFRKYYRKLFVPAKEDFKEIDLGIPTYGEASLISEIYRKLKSEGEIVEKIAPVVIKNKYLSGNRDYLETKNLYEAFLKTPGEMRIISREAFVESIMEGVRNGLFGLGYIEENEPKCRYFKEEARVELIEGEIIISEKLCVEKPKGEEVETPFFPQDKEEPEKTPQQVYEKEADGEQKDEIQEYKNVHLKLKVSPGQMSTIARIVSYLATKFKQCDITVEIKSSEGSIKIAEYENTVGETLRQANIDVEEEKLD